MMIKKDIIKTFGNDQCFAKIEKIGDKELITDIHLKYKGERIAFNSFGDFEKFLVDINELHKLLTQERK